MASYHAPHDGKDRSDWIAAGLHGRARWRLPLLMLGLLFGQGRRVVAAWIRAAGVSGDYRDYDYFLQSVGLRWRELGRRVLVLVLDQILTDTPRVLLAIDDSPTKRPFVRPMTDLGVTLVGRLRKDAALYDLPRREQRTRRGRKRKYGKQRLSLRKRAAHRQGWTDVPCTIYGQVVIKRVKTFVATHRTFGGAIRVVIVQERSGPQFFYCTDVNASVAEIIEAFADRSAIEQVFHDVKEVWGSGQQQVRNVWSNVACRHLNLWLHTLVELWCWNKPAAELTHREDSPWDAAERRPSHADRRKALQGACLAAEFSHALRGRPLPRQIREALKRLLRIAV